jgi:hypothetical protein
LITAVCFFLPWGRFSCLAIHKTVTGPQIGGAAWGAWFCALLAAAVVTVFLLRQRLSWAALASIGAAVLGFGAIGARAADAARGIHTPLGYVHPPKVGSIAIGAGAVGTVLGLVLMLVGGVFMYQTHRQSAVAAGSPDREATPAAPRPPVAGDRRSSGGGSERPAV